MATMFRNFSFAPASPPSYSAYEADRAAMNVSPTSKPDSQQYYLSRPPTPPCTMGDLALKLNRQSLRMDARRDNVSPGPPTPPSDEYPGHPLEQAAPRPIYSRVSASLLRMQRQSSARLQCSASHVRDISRLVQMMQHEEQCTVKGAGGSSRSCSASTTTSKSTVSDSDEAVDMDFDLPAQSIEALVGMPQWRAGDRRDSCIRVAKPVRMRRRMGNKVEKRRPL